MKQARIAFALAILGTAPLAAQEPEAAADSTIDLGSLLYNDDRGGLTVSSGKTYNRVEGLPVFVGPTYKDRIGRAEISLAALGIIRSSNKFHWDPGNLGHRLTADVRFGRHRGFAVGASTFDEVVSGLDESNALFEARRCLSCGNCFECDNCYGVCPDNAVIKLGPGKRFQFNYDYCKGCGICAAECPCGAIRMVPEEI